jgi:hypothetical protein
VAGVCPRRVGRHMGWAPRAHTADRCNTLMWRRRSALALNGKVSPPSMSEGSPSSPA